jgi:DNA-directed RNA polymerase subunit M/transcription elongation factor TFIIS
MDNKKIKIDFNKKVKPDMDKLNLIKINLIKTKSQNEELRDFVINKLHETELNKNLILPVENVIYNYSMNYSSTLKDNLRYYMNLSKHIINNLNSKNRIGNNYFANAINNNIISIDKIPTISPQEMFPDLWSDYNKNYKIKIAESIKGIEPNCELYICKNCNQNKTYITYKQIRSSDEPMSTIVKCCTIGCGKKWVLN